MLTGGFLPVLPAPGGSGPAPSQSPCPCRPGGHSAEELPALLPWAAGSLCPEEDLPRAGPPGASQVPAAAQQSRCHKWEKGLPSEGAWGGHLFGRGGPLHALSSLVPRPRVTVKN